MAAEKRNRKKNKKAADKKDPRSKLKQPDHRPLILSSSPHEYTTDSVPKIMWSVVGALVPATIAAVY